MFNRKTLGALAVALTATGAAAPALADDAGARTAQTLVQEARTYGQSEPRGAAAGQTDRPRDDRGGATRDGNQQRWDSILRKQSLGN